MHTFLCVWIFVHSCGHQVVSFLCSCRPCRHVWECAASPSPCRIRWRSGSQPGMARRTSCRCRRRPGPSASASRSSPCCTVTVESVGCRTLVELWLGTDKHSSVNWTKNRNRRCPQSAGVYEPLTLDRTQSDRPPLHCHSARKSEQQTS